jgi:N-formylglutamate amidohydrolase
MDAPIVYPVIKPSTKIALALVFCFILSVLLSVPIFAAERHAADKFVSIESGMLPIILSAPHGGREAITGVAVRRGIGVSQFTTGRDHNTKELAEGIASKLLERLGRKPFLVIAGFDRKYVDANRPSQDAYESEEARPYYEAYHRALAEHCENVRKLWGQGLLLDLHGQSTETEAIFRGTDNLKSVTDLERRFGQAALSGGKSILGLLERNGYKVFPAAAGGDREQRYTGGYTTRTYGSHRGTGIDAIQLEFGTNLRSRAYLERTATDVARAIVVFASAYLPLKITRSASGE